MNHESLILMYLQKIEKAMSMPHRREVFAQDVIRKLIQVYLNNKVNLLPEITQGIFETIYKYKQCLNLEIIENKDIINFINDFLKQQNFHINEFINKNKDKSYYFDLLKDLMKNRYSVRNYTDKSVSYDLIEKSLELANSLPTVNKNIIKSIQYFYVFIFYVKPIIYTINFVYSLFDLILYI